MDWRYSACTARPCRLVEAAVGEGHGPAAEHGTQRLLGGAVVERRRQALRADVGEARGRERPRKHVLRAELEEHGADLGGHPGVRDREDLGPAAVLPGTPDRRGRPAAGPEQAPHLAERADRVGHVHEAQRAQGGIEAPVRERQLLGIGALEADVADATLGCDPVRTLDHLAGDVGADDHPGLAHHPGHAQADQPGAAGDVQDPVAGPQVRHRRASRNGPARAGRPSLPRRRRRPGPSRIAARGAAVGGP